MFVSLTVLPSVGRSDGQTSGEIVRLKEHKASLPSNNSRKDSGAVEADDIARSGMSLLEMVHQIGVDGGSKLAQRAPIWHVTNHVHRRHVHLEAVFRLQVLIADSTHEQFLGKI